MQHATQLALGIILSSVNAMGESRIINGAPVAPGTYREVVSIRASGGATCTATIVGPRALVTAAHCATSGETVKFTFGERQYSARVTRSPLYPEKDHDLAVAVADHDIDVIPATIGGETTKGAELLLVGYGCTSPGGGGGNDGVLRVGTTVVTGFSNLDVVSKKAGGAALCFGDSGGPAYAGRDLIAIASKGDIQTTNYHARLDTRESREFLFDFAKDGDVEICGINADCRAN